MTAVNESLYEVTENVLALEQTSPRIGTDQEEGSLQKCKTCFSLGGKFSAIASRLRMYSTGGEVQIASVILEALFLLVERRLSSTREKSCGVFLIGWNARTA